MAHMGLLLETPRDELEVWEQGDLGEYPEHNQVEDSAIQNYLQIFAEKAMSHNKETGNDLVIHNFVDEVHPLDQDRSGLENDGVAFWKKGGNEEKMWEKAAFFAKMKDYDCFQSLQGPNKQTSDETHESLQQHGSYINSKNILLDECYFEERIPAMVACTIMESVAFQSLFCDIAIHKSQETVFSTFPDDLIKCFFAHGMHFLRLSHSGKNECFVQFSIDPAFKLKIEERVERKRERQERRAIREMAAGEKSARSYLPTTQTTRINMTPEEMETLKSKNVGPDGAELSDSSSDEDEGEEDEREAFERHVSQGMTEELSSRDNTATTIAEDEVLSKLEKFTTHSRSGTAYTLIDHNIRQFFDVYLRILIVLRKKDASSSRQYHGQMGFVIDNFVFFIAGEPTKKKK